MQKLLTLFLLLFSLKQAAAQTGCDRVWIGGCKSNPMDKVAEHMKRLWNEELSDSVWVGNNYFPFAIESVTINPKTIQVRYRYARKSEYWSTQDNQQILTKPGIVAVTYGMDSKNDELTGVPMMGTALLGQTTRSDDMVLIKNTTAVSEDYLYGQLPAKIFRIALHGAFKGSDNTLKGKGIHIVKNYREGIFPSTSLSVSEYYVVFTENKDGKSQALKFTRDGQLISRQNIDGQAFNYQGVSAASSTNFRTYKFGNSLSDFTLSRDDALDKEDFTLVDKESRDTRYVIDPRKLEIAGAVSVPDSFNSLFYGNIGSESVIVRALNGYTSDRGGCGSRGCTDNTGLFWDGISHFSEPIFDVAANNRELLVTTGSEYHYTLHTETFGGGSGTRDQYGYQFEDLGFIGQGFYNFRSNWFGVDGFGNRTIITTGSYYSHEVRELESFAIKADMNGNVYWAMPVGKISADIRANVIDRDGNAILVGRVREADGVHYDAYAIKLDSNGRVLGELTWGIPGGDEFFQSVAYDSNSNAFFVTGYKPELDEYDEPIAGSSLVLFQRLSAALKSEIED